LARFQRRHGGRLRSERRATFTTEFGGGPDLSAAARAGSDEGSAAPFAELGFLFIFTATASAAHTASFTPSGPPGQGKYPHLRSQLVLVGRVPLLRFPFCAQPLSHGVISPKRVRRLTRVDTLWRAISSHFTFSYILCLTF